MDSGTYFVGKSELLAWINSTLDLNFNKIEQTASGAVACQLLDALHPGSVNLSKVDFNAVNDYDCINNYKVLQAGFTKLHIDKPIEVNKLIKGRPLDNIEFMQWFKRYFDAQSGGEEVQYDGAARRAGSKTGDVKGRSLSRRTSQSGTAGTAGAAPATPSTARTSRDQLARVPSRKEPPPVGSGGKSLSRVSSRNGNDENEASNSQVHELTDQLAETKLKVDTVERERDFYFDKLRDIEILCQMPELQSIPVVKYFEQILYATDEAEARECMLQAQKMYTQANGSHV